MGQINTNNYPTVNSLLDADLLIVENATNGTGTTTPKQLRENAIGTATLQTSAQTVTGAINELKHEIDLGAGVARYDVDTITSGYLGQFSGSANLLLLHLTTDGTADATNGYMMMLSYSRPVARFAYGRLVDADGVAYKQDVYADNTIICKISNSGEGTESDPVRVVILGIINAGFMLTPTAVISDRDIIDGQGNTLSVLAEALTKTASGNPVVISDCAGGKARSLKTVINAIQDLHGYDKPWAAGAGKNKCNATTTTADCAAGATVSAKIGEITLTETASLLLSFEQNKAIGSVQRNTLVLRVPNTTTDYYPTNVGQPGLNAGYHEGLIENMPAGTYDVRMWLQVPDIAVSVTNFMVRNASISDNTFAPYSNICPISGRDRVVVDDHGKNIFNVNDAEIGTAWNGAPNSARARLIIELKVGQTYTIKANGTSTLDSWYGILTDVIPPSSSGGTLDNPWTFTANKRYLSLGFNKNDIALSDIEALKLQLEEGSTATPYVPYAHSSATIQLGQTVYGADINWDTGVMTVKTACPDLGGLTWTTDATGVANKNRFYADLSPLAVVADSVNLTSISSQYTLLAPGGTYSANADGYTITAASKIYIYDEAQSSATAVEFKTAMSGVQVEYTLATPTTIQLTPEQLEMLKGYNRVSIDNGSIEVGYIAKLT